MRTTLLLLALLAACALSLVTSQHQARKLFAGIEREHARAKALDVEWGQLQLEARTWALPSRIESIAQERLGMRAPDARRVQLLRPERGEAAEPGR
ncbi:MAG: cell division protein FtsL [Burkholderiales bacterium]|nr:cell division protein FtsL [Burkholderiales bacterium]